MATTTKKSGPAPVFVLLHAKNCGFCNTFIQAHWTTTQAELKKLRPDIRIMSVLNQDMSGKSYDHSKFPQGLELWGKFFPSFIMIPGPLWDAAMADKTLTLKPEDGVYGMNLMFRNKVLEAYRGYTFDSKGVVTWVSKILGNVTADSSTQNKDSAEVSDVIMAPNANSSTGLGSNSELIIKRGAASSGAAAGAPLSKPLVASTPKIYGSVPAAPRAVPHVAAPAKVTIPAKSTPTTHAPYTSKPSTKPSPLPSTVATASSSASAPKVEKVGSNICTIKLVPRPPNRY